MSDWRAERELFYEQFNTVIEQHRAWCHTPEGTMQIMKDPWKARSPEVRIVVVGEPNVSDILYKIQQARLQQMNSGTHLTQHAMNAAAGNPYDSQYAANLTNLSVFNSATEDLINKSLQVPHEKY
jgi:hypothetical protein